MRFMRTIAVTLTILSTPASYALATDGDPVRSCIQDICGPVDRLVNAQGAGNFSRFQPLQIKEIFDSQITPRLRLGFNLEFDMIANYLEFWDALDGAFKIENLAPEQRQLLALSIFFSGSTKGIEKSLKFVAGGKYAVDRDNWQKLEPSRSRKEIDAIGGYFEYLLNNSYYKTSQSIESVPFEYFKKYFSIESDEDLKANAQKILTAMEILRSKVGPNFVDESDLRILKQAAETGKLESFERRKYVKAVAFYYSIYPQLSDDGVAFFKDFPITIADIRFAFAPGIQKLRDLLSDSARVKTAQDKVLEKCRKQVNAFMSTLPSEFAISRASRMAEAVRKAALAVAPGYFSGKDLETVRKAIAEKSGFTFPESNKTGADLLLRYFREGYEDLKLIREKSKTDIDASNRFNFFVSLTFSLLGAKDTPEDGLFNMTDSMCEAIEPPSLTDKALSEKGDILASWQSVLWPEYGAPIMAHELGHVVSSAVGHNAIQEPIDCKLKRHSDFYAKVAETNHDEEDWADTFSSSVMRELAKTWPYVKNKGCLLLPIDREKEDLDMPNISIVDDKEESHSTGIFRLINVQIDLGRPLPASCLAVPVFKKISEGPVCSQSIPNNRER